MTNFQRVVATTPGDMSSHQPWQLQSASGMFPARSQVTTEDGHTVTAEAIVQATDSPINVNLAVHARQSAYRSYVTGYKIPKARTGFLPFLLHIAIRATQQCSCRCPCRHSVDCAVQHCVCSAPRLLREKTTHDVLATKLTRHQLGIAVQDQASGDPPRRGEYKES